jgi:hypothetical protein
MSREKFKEKGRRGIEPVQEKEGDVKSPLQAVDRFGAGVILMTATEVVLVPLNTGLGRIPIAC